MRSETRCGFKKCFPGKLTFWFWHCVINALPSYLIAVVWLGLWDSPVAHFAMGCAVATFVVLYSVLTSLPGPLANKDNLFTRAVRVGLILRLVISIQTVCLVPTGVFLLFSPDLWCGQVAVGIVRRVYEFIGLEASLFQRVDDHSAPAISGSIGFFEVYFATILEGIILSFMLFVFCVIAIIILQMRDRKKMLREGRI